MLTSTGKIIPSGSFAVLALNCLQKSMMLSPCGPRAVPTGGAGVAFAAGNCSFTTALTFFAIPYPLHHRTERSGWSAWPHPACGTSGGAVLILFELRHLF